MTKLEMQIEYAEFCKREKLPKIAIDDLEAELLDELNRHINAKNDGHLKRQIAWLRDFDRRWQIAN